MPQAPSPQDAMYPGGPKAALGNQPDAPEADEGEGPKAPQDYIEGVIEGVKGLTPTQAQNLQAALMQMIQNPDFVKSLSGGENGATGDQGGPGPAQ